MKLYSWNVNGIRAVEEKGLLAPFLREHQPDIACFQEIKATEDQVVERFAASYPEYDQYWFPAVKKGYSGTAIFSKIPPIEAIYGIPEEITAKYNLVDSYGDTTTEGRVITLEFDEYFVSTVYTPNAKDDLSRIPMRQAWDPAYLAFVSSLEAEKPVIFCGDFNVAAEAIDLARPKENEGKKGFTEAERAGFRAMREAGFIDTLRHFEPTTPELYTWWSHWGGARARNVGWRIDYVMVSEPLVPLLKSARIHPDVLGSDHCPVSIDIALT